MTSKKCFIYTVYKTYLEVLVISNRWTENEEKPFAHSHAYMKSSKPLFFKEMKDYLIEKYHVGDSIQDIEQSSRKASVSRSFPTNFETDRRFLSCFRSIRPTIKRPVHTIKLSSRLFSDE